MQVFRMVRGGIVDSVIAFDELPETMLINVRRGPCAGFPRHWREFLGVKHGDTHAEPFYILDYIGRNADKEKWQEICHYVKRNVEQGVRMLDKVEAMARPFSPDAYSEITLEPEDVPVIPLPKVAKADSEETPEPRRRGRRPKSEEPVAA